MPKRARRATTTAPAAPIAPAWTVPWSKPTGRKLGTKTKLARKMKATGRPAYQIGAAAGIESSLLYAYAAGRKTPGNLHISRLCAVLGCEPSEIRD